MSDATNASFMLIGDARLKKCQTAMTGTDPGTSRFSLPIELLTAIDW